MGGIRRVKDRLEQSTLEPGEANNKYLHVWHLGLMVEPSAFQKYLATSSRSAPVAHKAALWGRLHSHACSFTSGHPLVLGLLTTSGLFAA